MSSEEFWYLVKLLHSVATKHKYAYTMMESVYKYASPHSIGSANWILKLARLYEN
jgi:hypothetical protein